MNAQTNRETNTDGATVSLALHLTTTAAMATQIERLEAAVAELRKTDRARESARKLAEDRELVIEERDRLKKQLATIAEILDVEQGDDLEDAVRALAEDVALHGKVAMERMEALDQVEVLTQQLEDAKAALRGPVRGASTGLHFDDVVALAVKELQALSAEKAARDAEDATHESIGEAIGERLRQRRREAAEKIKGGDGEA